VAVANGFHETKVALILGEFLAILCALFSAVAAVLWGTLGKTDKSEQKPHDLSFHKQNSFMKWQRTKFENDEM